MYAAFGMEVNRGAQLGLILWGIFLGINLLLSFFFYIKWIKQKTQVVKFKEQASYAKNKLSQLFKEYHLMKKHITHLKERLGKEFTQQPTPKGFSHLSLLSEYEINNAQNAVLDFYQYEEEFTLRLKEKVSDLTPFECQLCYFIKLNFSIGEIAKLTKSTYKSIESHKYRLTRKVKAQYSSSLSDFLQQIPLQ